MGVLVEPPTRAPLRLEGLRDRVPWAGVALAVLVLYTFGVEVNPPGFYLDEASISYNAYSISVDGRDEHGVPWPVYFQTWDASVAVNPVYVYSLAAVFKVFGPSILAARLLSAVAGFLAAVLLGALAGRATGRRDVGLIVAGSALLMPWLFQVSRLVFEVALFPLVLTVVLTLVHRVHARPAWSALEIGAVGSMLGVLTYTYTIGRLLGPLLALGLVLFASRQRARSIVLTWIVFGIALLPAVAFNVANSGALSARADLLGYVRPGVPLTDIASQFINHVLANLDPRRLLLLGDPNIRHHVPVMGSVLAATLALVLIGLDRVAHGEHRDPWVRYVLYGLGVALVPASLTIDDFHTLRLIALPVFLLLVAAMGARWLAERGGVYRAGLLALAALSFVQGAVFQLGFWREGPGRGGAFDAAFPTVFEAALATGERPIYLRDQGNLPGYIEAYWYGTLRGMTRDDFVRLRPDELPPAGAIVLGTERSCGACDVLAQDGDYIAYRAGDLASTGVIPNGDFEEVGDGELGAFGAPIPGWASSPDAALLPDGARTDGAHLALAHLSDTTSTKQASSSVVAVTGGAQVHLEAFVRGAPDNGAAVTVTVALVELDANREFVAWYTKAVELAPGEDWQQVLLEPVRLGTDSAFVQVTCYLEPGGEPGDTAEFDDIVVEATS